MKGKLIVFEGLDCSGKTSTIEELMKTNKDFVYNKGIGSDTFLGRLALKFPCTFSFLSELAYSNLFRVRRYLKEGKTVLQDRYDISISSYIPLADKWYNRLFIRLFEIVLIRPDAIVYLYSPLKERLKRLRIKGDKYALMLLRDKEIIKEREKRYLAWYRGFDGEKIKINTKENSLLKSVAICRNFLKGVIER